MVNNCLTATEKNAEFGKNKTVRLFFSKSTFFYITRVLNANEGDVPFFVNIYIYITLIFN